MLPIFSIKLYYPTIELFNVSTQIFMVSSWFSIVPIDMKWVRFLAGRISISRSVYIMELAGPSQYIQVSVRFSRVNTAACVAHVWAIRLVYALNHPEFL